MGGSQEAIQLLTNIRAAIAPAWLLIGEDHTCDPKRLETIYGGPLMAAFRKNSLVRIIRELGAQIAPDDFEHKVRVLGCPIRGEAHAVARKAAAIEVASRKTQFASGGIIRTGTSWKHTVSEFTQLIVAAGWSPVMNWKSDCPACTLHLLHPACESGR